MQFLNGNTILYPIAYAPERAYSSLPSSGGDAYLRKVSVTYSSEYLTNLETQDFYPIFIPQVGETFVPTFMHAEIPANSQYTGTLIFGYKDSSTNLWDTVHNNTGMSNFQLNNNSGAEAIKSSLAFFYERLFAPDNNEFGFSVNFVVEDAGTSEPITLTFYYYLLDDDKNIIGLQGQSGGTPQTLSIAGNLLSISGGNTVTLPASTVEGAINIDEVEVLANQWTDLSLTLSPQ